MRSNTEDSAAECFIIFAEHSTAEGSWRWFDCAAYLPTYLPPYPPTYLATARSREM